LNQLVTNLLDNAIKYTQPDGSLLISTEAGRDAMFQVRDDGAGISADALPRVFDLFTRGDFGLQRAPSGLGIGLTLVKRIAELHGGTVKAASGGPAAEARSQCRCRVSRRRRRAAEHPAVMLRGRGAVAGFS
jgi:two-component system, sensor histidine kinase